MSPARTLKTLCQYVVLFILAIGISSLSCLGAIDDLNRVIPGTHPPNAAWGGSLQAVTQDTVLVGNGLNFGGLDVPVDLIDVRSGLVLQSYAEPPNYPTGDQFGASAIQVGNTVLVSAFATDLSQNPVIDDAGVVHVYDAASGAYQRTIENPNPSGSGSFGISMAPLGNLAVIGTFDDRSSNGTAYLIDPLTGNIVNRFDNPTGDRRDHYGSTVTVIGNDVLVGTRDSGNVYRFDGTTGNLLQTYSHPTGGLGLFGFSIAAFGDTIAIGAFQDSGANNQSGTVYVFDKDSATLLSTIVPSDPFTFGWFGFDVALLDDDTLAISQLMHQPPSGETTGIVYIYDLDTEQILAEIPNPVPQVSPQFQRFGGALAEVGGSLVVGSARGNFVSDDGPIYIYQGLFPEPTSCSIVMVCGVVMLMRTKR